MDSLKVGPSRNPQAWQAALYGDDDKLLQQLCANESPGATYFQLATFINGLYRSTQHPLVVAGIAPAVDVTTKINRVLPHLKALRKRMGWQQRELDIDLMCWIRRASALSIVLGAGVTIAAGGPSWMDLVNLLLDIALEKGHEVTTMVPTEDSTPEKKEVRRKVIRVERFDKKQEKEAKNIQKLINKNKATTEDLMRGAQLCYDLFGQHLFTHLTQIIYSRATEPGPIHRAIAELAHGQFVPDRGPGIFPGWDAIISYNFDDLMGEALAELKIPHARWAMRKGEIAGDPDESARKAGQQGWYQSIYHLHGYTPRKLFLITHVEFVFSTAQYFQIYQKGGGIIDKILNEYLANPVHVALYIGCSFSDEAMNNLLREAAKKYPGRFHFVILKLPNKFKKKEPSAGELEKLSEFYYEMDVYPIWVHEFSEIPEIIQRLK
ncbi:MAG: SIR2 family protein [Candidatus Odinarchaeota archaeon]